MKEVTQERLTNYQELTQEALRVAKQAPIQEPAHAQEIFDMVQRYLSDAQYFRKQGDWTRAFAAVNYAHGWLDCGARLRVYLVSDNHLFTEDGED